MINMVIPYRNMPQCKDIFLQYLHNSKNAENIKVTIIEQFADDKKFNLGKLQNVGFDIISHELRHDDWIYLHHPIDIFPCNDMERYLHWAQIMRKDPKITVGFGEPTADNSFVSYYKSILFSPQTYKAINGYSNRYWGWGREDDDVALRTQSQQLGYFKEWANFYWWDENDTQIRDHSTKNLSSPEFSRTKQMWNENNPDPSLTILLNIIQNGGYTSKMLLADGLSTLTYEILEAKQIQKNVRQITVKI